MNQLERQRRYTIIILAGIVLLWCHILIGLHSGLWLYDSYWILQLGLAPLILYGVVGTVYRGWGKGFKKMRSLSIELSQASRLQFAILHVVCGLCYTLTPVLFLFILDLPDELVQLPGFPRMLQHFPWGPDWVPAVGMVTLGVEFIAGGIAVLAVRSNITQ